MDAIGSESRVRTITDLARLIGVTPSTVSRALADNPVVNKDTKARIKALAQQHGFRPNQMARGLRTRQTRIIGIVVPLGHEKRQHLSDPFFMTMLGALADALTESGHNILLSRVIPDADDWLEQIVQSGLMDGILVIGQSDQFDAIERLAKRYRPLVVWGGVLPGQIHCAVGTDNAAGGRLAASHLIGRGCKRIAFLGEIRTLELAERYRGLCEVAAAHGLDTPLQLDTHLASDIMVGEIASHLDRYGPRIDGVVAASDVIAMRLVRVLADRNVHIPSQIAITGFDDLPLAAQTIPRLTTVKQDIVAGAQLMVAALIARIAGEDAPSVQMTPHLIVRDTA